MYHIFFQPFDAINAIKKHSVRAFVLMLFVGSLLMALSATLMVRLISNTPNLATSPIWLSITQLNPIQLFIIMVAAIFASSIVKSFVLHVTMKLFTDKGAFVDALKIISVTTFLPGVYILLIIILGAIPVVGLGLAALGGFLAVMITITVALRALSVAYKTDLLTVIIGLGVMAVSAMIALHIVMVSAFGISGMSFHRYATNMPFAPSVQSPGVQY